MIAITLNPFVPIFKREEMVQAEAYREEKNCENSGLRLRTACVSSCLEDLKNRQKALLEEVKSVFNQFCDNAQKMASL